MLEIYVIGMTLAGIEESNLPLFAIKMRLLMNDTAIRIIDHRNGWGK